ncbi:MAG: hypothetical protein U9P12_05630 [Verrucomicrobiota bacterium]|nr:hypothetical protein [Verrucomicrobiota bacterium]
MWRKREIENYFCHEDVLMAYAGSNKPNDLFAFAEQEKRTIAMREAIAEVSTALETFGKPGPWSEDTKASDDVLEPIFRAFSKKMNIPLIERKRDFHKLVEFLRIDDVDNEIREKLDLLCKVAKSIDQTS